MANHEQICEQVERVEDVARSLAEIERALARVGLVVLAVEVQRHVVDLQFAAGKISLAVRGWVREEFEQAQQSSANVLAAALAGAELGKKETA